MVAKWFKIVSPFKSSQTNNILFQKNQIFRNQSVDIMLWKIQQSKKVYICKALHLWEQSYNKLLYTMKNKHFMEIYKDNLDSGTSDFILKLRSK